MMRKLLTVGLAAAAMGLAAATGETVATGTYDNMLENGRLELFAGSFPDYWRLRTGQIGYYPGEGPQGGGILRVVAPAQSVVVRQDWTFSLSVGEKYRMSVWARAEKFDARRCEMVVFNNGWSKSATLEIEPDQPGWQRFEKEFVAFPSNAALYSCALVVEGVTQGQVELAELVVEPATASAQKSALAYLQDVPLRKLYFLNLKCDGRLDAGSDALRLRYRGTATAADVVLDGGEPLRCAIDGKGFFSVPLRDRTPGEHRVQIRIGAWQQSRRFTIGGATHTMLRRNNLHRELAAVAMTAEQRGEFTVPETGWIAVRLPEGAAIKLEKSGRSLRHGDFHHLEAGVYGFTPTQNGKLTVAAIADTVFYQLCGGPYLKGLAKNDWDFAEKNIFPAVTTFYNPAVPPFMLTRKLKTGNFRALKHVSAEEFNQGFTAERLDKKAFAGIGIDEYGAASPRGLAGYVKRMAKLGSQRDYPIFPWLTGMAKDGEVLTEFLALTRDGGGTVLLEIYPGSNFQDEKSAQKALESAYLERVRGFEAVWPGIRKNLGCITAHGNIPFSFTMDNNFDVDFKYFLDMQFQLLANHPELDGIAAVGSWGGNYATNELNSWLAALLRHYVIAGETRMLSEKYGFTFKPGHLENGRFADGLKHWRSTGKVATEVADGFSAVLKQFNTNPDLTAAAVRMAPGATLRQELRKLVPGRVYKLRVISDFPRPEIRLDGAGDWSRAVDCRAPGKDGKNYYEALFTATAATAELSLRVPDSAAMASVVNGVSVMPYFDGTIR